MWALIKKSRTVVFGVILIGTVFYAGLLYGSLRERILYEFPIGGALTGGIAENPIPPAEQRSSFTQIALDGPALHAKRRALEKKIFGSGRSRTLPAMTKMDTASFATTFAGEENFDKYYRHVFADRAIQVELIHGSFDEIPGYEWKSVLLRQSKTPPAGLFIYHQGHDGSPLQFRASNTVIRTMLERGYDVAAMSMPGVGWNRIGQVRIKTWDGWGYLAQERDTRHDLFAMIDTGKGHFIRFFVEPVLATIDFAEARHPYSTIIMSGHSGGGWTTTIAAALDPRIRYSVSYAGTLPFFARRTPGDRGDAEQFDTAFYRDFPYTLLYELASLSDDKKRVHTQLFHSDDTCCFDEMSVDAFRRYLEARGRHSGRDLRISVLRGQGHYVLSDALLGAIGLSGVAELKPN